MALVVTLANEMVRHLSVRMKPASQPGIAFIDWLDLWILPICMEDYDYGILKNCKDNEVKLSFTL